MKISVNAPSETKRYGLESSVIGRLSRTLARFSHRITSVNVTLTDENGPRGGIDKLCRLSVVMPRLGELTASATHDNPFAAVAQAASRVRRIILTKLKRPKSLQIRNRNTQFELSDSQSKVESQA